MDRAPRYLSATALGVLCGAGAAFFWALGFVAARHGVSIGLSPFTIALHRYVWPGLVLLPIAAVGGFSEFGALGLGRGIALAVFGGLPIALFAYEGYLFVPLGHGAVIQPSCAALGGLLLARLVLKERLPLRRVAGALAIIIGLGVIGHEALKTMGAQGVAGDLLFVAAGCFFAVFGMLVRLWQVTPMRATTMTSVLSLAGLPFLLFRIENLMAAGFLENLLQAAVQGALAGAGATYLFARAVTLLGAARAALFPALVPPFTLSIGYAALGEVPSASQLVGLVIVLVGFQLTQKG